MPKKISVNDKAAADRAVVEARVDEMMKAGPDVQKPEVTKIDTPATPQEVTSDSAASAPLLPDSALPPEVQEEAKPTLKIAPIEKVPEAQESVEIKSIPVLDLDTPESDAAIADIVAQEADQVLAAEDAGLALAKQDAEEVVVNDKPHGHPVFWFFITLLAIIAVIAAVVLVHPSWLPNLG